VRASLETYAPDNLLIISGGLVLQKEVILEQRKTWGSAKEGFAKVDKNGYLKD
jgi:hypothetical protein